MVVGGPGIGLEGLAPPEPPEGPLGLPEPFGAPETLGVAMMRGVCGFWRDGPACGAV